jgi:transcriptional regulator with XRE-family HTH domain
LSNVDEYANMDLMHESGKPSEVVARRISELRNAREPAMSQTELARRLTALGFKYDQTAISKLEKGKRPFSIDLVCALAVALDAPLLALLAPLDGSKVKLGDGKEVTSNDFQMWVQGFGHLSGMDVERYLDATKGLKIPKQVLERARSEALAVKRARVAKELEKLDKQIGGES